MLGVGPLHVGLREVRVQLDLVERRDDVGLRRAASARWCGMKLLTPIARTRPSAYSASRALYACTVLSNRSGAGWCRISTSIVSTPSLPVAFSNACSVSS